MEVAPNNKYKIRHIRPWAVVLQVVVLVLGGGLILLGCDGSNQDRLPTKERNDMELAKSYSRLDVAIPPIDRETPSNTETATFALG
jgi:hypothetical protein